MIVIIFPRSKQYSSNQSLEIRKEIFLKKLTKKLKDAIGEQTTKIRQNSYNWLPSCNGRSSKVQVPVFGSQSGSAPQCKGLLTSQRLQNDSWQHVEFHKNSLNCSYSTMERIPLEISLYTSWSPSSPKSELSCWQTVKQTKWKHLHQKLVN